MARIEMEANAEEETSGGGGNFPAAPRGIYTLQVSDYSLSQKTSANAKNPGVPKTNFTCEIADQGEHFGKKVWHTVTWLGKGKKGHGMCLHFLHAVGMPYDGALDFEEEEFQGKQFKALIEVEPYEKDVNGKVYLNERNVIAQIYTLEDEIPDELPPGPEKRPLRKLQKVAAAVAAGAQGDQEEAPF